MTNLQRLNSVRNLFRQWLASQSVEVEMSPPVETLLIRDGYYRGRRFQHQGYQAVWFAEEEEIKFFLPDGQLATSMNVDPLPVESYVPQRRAA